MEFSILECNMDRLTKKINTIQNKCKKYNNSFTFEIIGSELKEVKIPSLSVGIPADTVTLKYIKINVEGIAKINNFQFVAELQHTKNGNIIKGINNIEIPQKYYTTTPVCDHCKQKRIRKYTYIVYNTETNEFKQVGKTCLTDYTNGLSAELVAKYISLYDELIKGESFIASNGNYEQYYNVNNYLLHVIETINNYGYVKTGNINSTKNKSFDFYLYYKNQFNKKYSIETKKEIDKINYNYNTESNKKVVKNAIEWIINIESNTNNYLHNLQTICKNEYASFKNLGILASLLIAYKKIWIIKKRLQKKKKLKKLLHFMEISVIKSILKWIVLNA